MYYKIEQTKNILANHKNCIFSLDHLCSSALEYIQHLEAGIDRCYELAKQVESAQPKWISVEERLPVEDETVIVCADDGCVYAAQYWGHGKWRRELIGCIRSDTDVAPTHWMPLPEPPEEE